MADYHEKMHPDGALASNNLDLDQDIGKLKNKGELSGLGMESEAMLND